MVVFASLILSLSWSNLIVLGGSSSPSYKVILRVGLRLFSLVEQDSSDVLLSSVLEILSSFTLISDLRKPASN